MYINSNMQRMMKIALFILTGYLHGEMLPENGAMLNYTQVFFSWDQIPSVESYQFTVQTMGTGEELDLNVTQNSVLLTDFLDWHSTYTWFICGLFADDSSPFCSEIYSFNINPLPDNFPDNTNVSNYNETLYQEGITLLDFESLHFSAAVDHNGYPVWFADIEIAFQRFAFRQFLKNGNILGLGPWKGYEIDLNSNIIFESPEEFTAHHDFHKTSNDTYFIISNIVEYQYCPEECNDMLPDEIPWKGDIFTEIDQDGNEIWSWNTFDYIDSTEYNPYFFEIYTGWNDVDWTHSNSMFYDENSESVFISLRNLSRITKIDYTSKDIIWNLGETDFMNDIYFKEDLDFSMQHSIKVLNNGNLLFFDNHRYLSPELSRCIEIAYNELDYNVDIVWEHVLPAELYTDTRGECDRLENGNTLITAGTTGNALEVTPDHEVVWQISVGVTEVGNIKMDRSERIQNLHPIAFSLGISEYTGNVAEPFVEPVNGMITANIYSSGWGEGWYIYGLQDTLNTEMISDSVFVQPFENATFHIDVSNLPSSTYSLDVYPADASDKLQSFEFSLHGSIFLGDMNSDGILNVLDIIVLINLILTNNNSNPAGDLNQDGNQNILDIVSLVNLILDN